jgi:hypothetical protein
MMFHNKYAKHHTPEPGPLAPPVIGGCHLALQGAPGQVRERHHISLLEVCVLAPALGSPGNLHLLLPQNARRRDWDRHAQVHTLCNSSRSNWTHRSVRGRQTIHHPSRCHTPGHWQLVKIQHQRGHCVHRHSEVGAWQTCRSPRALAKGGCADRSNKCRHSEHLYNL